MTCPNDQILQRLMLGQLLEVEAEALALHLEECDRCAATVEAQPADDTLVAAARTASGVHEPESHAVQALVERFSRMIGADIRKAAAPHNPLHEVEERTNRPASADLQAILTPPQESDELGRLGPYRVLKILGAGGMGVVFQADDPTLKRLVAIKTLQPSIAANSAARARFLREARAVAAMDDERIVAIHFVGEDRGIPYFAMPLLRGQTLEDWLQHVERTTGAGKLPVAEAVRIACETARGLAFAHGRGLIHRDVKPGNIFLKDEGTAPARVKLLDFGLARAIDDELSLTHPGMVIGTPAYIAPEQRIGSPTDERCDLFSLGCVLYRMTTGRTPLTAAALRTPGPDSTAPVPPHQLNSDVPPELSTLIQQLLAGDPAQRPCSAQAVAEQLATIGQKLTVPALRPVRRLIPWRRAGVAAALVLAAVLTVVMLVRTERGEFIIETDDPDVAVMIAQAGGISLHDRKTDRTYVLSVGKHNLPTGEYEIDVRNPVGKLEFSTRQFTIKGEHETKVKVSLRPRQLAPFDAWMAQVAALPADEQVARVGEKLRELNPDFDGTVGPRVEDGKVVEARIITDQVTDISPLRALAELEMLTCHGSASGQGRLVDISPLRSLTKLFYLDFSANRVGDLAPLRGLTKLQELGCWANPITDLRPLRGLPLKTLHLDHTFVTDADLWPLADLPLQKLHLKAPYVVELRSLAELRLRHLYCEFRPERHPQTLRAMKTLQRSTTRPWRTSGKPTTRGVQASSRGRSASPPCPGPSSSPKCRPSCASSIPASTASCFPKRRTAASSS
ncbi:MAG: serine/threonine protein kinase [Gemmataceae bacterium]|nr:serine/threonine protein kinase [Gemmataceae bacterium]MCI0737410.1 serine/threonine protein kinase [Gemmataceae bacterium]